MDHLEWTIRELDEAREAEARYRLVEARLRRWAWVPLGILGALLIAAIVLRLEG